MAIYRIQRLYSSINDKLQRADRNGYMNYAGVYDNGQSRVHQNARKEIIETGRTDGKFAKESVNLATIGGATAGGLAGALGAAHFKGSNKKLALAAAGGAALGGVASRKLNKSYQKRIAKNRHSDKNQRYVDNIKVADGYMTVEDFDKKWKKSKEFSKVLEKEFTKVRDAKKLIKLKSKLLGKAKKKGVDPAELTSSFEGRSIVEGALVNAGSRKPYSEKTWNSMIKGIESGKINPRVVLKESEKIKKLTGGHMQQIHGLL